jgi:hypothetical protein
MVLVLLVRIDRRRAMPWDRKELKYLGIDSATGHDTSSTVGSNALPVFFIAHM